MTVILFIRSPSSWFWSHRSREFSGGGLIHTAGTQHDHGFNQVSTDHKPGTPSTELSLYTYIIIVSKILIGFAVKIGIGTSISVILISTKTTTKTPHGYVVAIWTMAVG